MIFVQVPWSRHFSFLSLGAQPADLLAMTDDVAVERATPSTGKKRKAEGEQQVKTPRGKNAKFEKPLQPHKQYEKFETNNF
jgi:hypothetical protein